MDRSTWMYKIPRGSVEYVHYLSGFIKAVEDYKVKEGKREILCPCKVCKNCVLFENSNEISGHLVIHGFMDKYTTWSRHGDLLSNSNPDVSNFNDHCNEDLINDNSCDNLDGMLHDLEENIAEKNYDKFQQLFEDFEKPLYDGCRKFSKLSAVLKLLNLKANNGWSDKSFTSLLVILHEMLPEDNELPVSLYQAKKLMCPIGLEIERIHACPNDCVLYRNQYKDLHECPKCGTSRHKEKKRVKKNNDDVTKNGPPAKLLWYLPIVPRLRRLLANSKEAKLLCWHKEERKNNGKLRHVADSPQWRNIDSEFVEFGEEVRNIRFGLSSDGINPFGNMSNRHSTWPILLCIYNLPPWLCMKRKYIMMALLIQGPKQPGNDIDVYLAPLVDDLKDLDAIVGIWLDTFMQIFLSK